MIKSLRTKILSCFFLLALVMIIGVVLIAISFRSAVAAANTMSGTYLAIERDFGDANTNLQNLVKRFFLVQAMAPTGALDSPSRKRCKLLWTISVYRYKKLIILISHQNIR